MGTYFTPITDNSPAGMKAALLDMGFIIGDRNPRINTNYPGKFMVAESHEPSELPTKDGSNGPWCIVGDDLDKLIEEAYRVWSPEYDT
jgi:hypothetical protein